MGIGFFKSKNFTRHMQLVFNVFGESTKTLDCEVTQTVGEIRDEISAMIEHDDFVLINNGIEMINDYQLNEYDGSIINIEHPVVGEGKGGKRKKKVYKTAKRIPHKKVNIKMRALRYYTVESNGEVKRTYKTCPQCGHYMSQNWNRYYCGFCHFTLVRKDAPKEPPKKKVVEKKVVEEEVKKAPAKGKKGKK